LSYEALFYPRGVAVTGSAAPGKLASVIIGRLIEGGMDNVYAVNPKAQGVGSVKGYASIADIPDPVDLVVIVSPAFTVADVLEDAGKSGVRAAAIITSGFSEAGNAEGEREIISVAKKYGIRFVGPNCAGVVNTHSKLLATLETRPPKGNIAIISQSGAVGGTLMAMAGEQGLGVSKFVSFGNGLDVDIIEFLTWLKDDSETKVVALYLETVRNGRGFMSALTELAKNKPVVVVKSGRTATGHRAAMSHTGSMAGADKVFDAALKLCGALRVETLEDMFDLCKGFSSLLPVEGKRLMVVTNSGGPGVLTTDKAEELGMSLDEPSKAMKDVLKGFLPAYAGLKNPIDLTVEGTGEQYGKAVEAAMQEYDSAVVLYVGTPYLKSAPIAGGLADTAKKTGKPIVAALSVGSDIKEALGILSKAGIPNFVSGERAVRVLSYMAQYSAWKSKGNSIPPADVPDKKTSRSGSMLEPEAMDILMKNGVPVPPHKFCKTRAEAAEACAALGYPAVMKVVSPDIIHKSEYGGVILSINSEEKALAAFDRLEEIAHGLRFEGVICYPMLQGGHEVILGLTRDPQFGPVIAFGLGGIYTEVLKDVVLRIAPVTKETALDMIESIRSSAILKGIRGGAPADLDALAETIVNFSQLPFRYSDISEADLNPVLVFEKGLVALDARIL